MLQGFEKICRQYEYALQGQGWAGGVLSRSALYGGWKTPAPARLKIATTHCKTTAHLLCRSCRAHAPDFFAHERVTPSALTLSFKWGLHIYTPPCQLHLLPVLPTLLERAVGMSPHREAGRGVACCGLAI